MKASTLKRLEDLEVEAFARKLQAMSDDELRDYFIEVDTARRRAEGLPLDITREQQLSEGIAALEEDIEAHRK